MKSKVEIGDRRHSEPLVVYFAQSYALATRVGNRRHSAARAETTGYGLASHRAFDLQPRCRLRSVV